MLLQYLIMVVDQEKEEEFNKGVLSVTKKLDRTNKTYKNGC